MSQVTEQESPLSAARGKVSYAAERATKMALCVSEIADVVFGCEPPQPASTNGQPSRMGEAGLLHDDLDALSLSLDFLERQINRLASLGVRPPEQTMSAQSFAGAQANVRDLGRVRAY